MSKGPAENRTERVVIVGGGSAGWIVAGYLTSLIRERRKHDLSITLIESPTTPRIGVGEATVPSIRASLDLMGVPEAAFLTAADATMKQAIEFVGWEQGGAERFFHPFDRRTILIPDQFRLTWLESDRATPWNDYASPQTHFCKENVIPKAAGWRDYQSIVPYAFHMDAEKFADYLQATFCDRGVEHIRAHISGVEHDENGDVASLLCEDERRVDGDLFIDCSGMRGILIEGALETPYRDYSKWLLCDRAVAAPLPYDRFPTQVIHPYTRSIAMTSGWSWEIPLQSRRGTGYVYSSAFCSDDDAARELFALHAVAEGEAEPRFLRFRVGRRAECWRRNVVAIGMSSGFIEPLESTALYLVEAAASTLCDGFPFTKEAFGPAARQFNGAINDLYSEVLDFVNLHYALSKRDDTPFWRAARDASAQTETLSFLLELWRHKAPSNFDFPYALRLFSSQSYEHILFGINADLAFGAPRGARPVAEDPDVRTFLEKSRGVLVEHAEWLRSVH